MIFFRRLRFFATMVSVIAPLSTPVFAELFSPFNRYQLAIPLLDSVNRAALDTASAPLFSLPNRFESESTHPFLTLSAPNQVVTATIFTLQSYEQRGAEHIPNTFVGSRVAYHSPFLSGAMQLDVHTTSHSGDTTLAGRLNDFAPDQKLTHTDFDHITGTGTKDFNLTEGWLRLGTDNVSLTMGNKKYRWGPGYKGTLSLSGTTQAPFYYYYLDMGLGDIAHLSAFLCGFDDDVLFPHAEILTHSTTERYSAGQRIDLRLGRHLQIGLYELVDFYSTALLNRYANPLTFYYAANISDNSGQVKANVMGGADINLLIDPFRCYVDFLNDDISSLDTNHSPNAWGGQLGAVWYGRGAVSEIGIEYSHITWGTYTHWAPGLARHTYWGESRGWPWGNDQDLYTLHAIAHPQKQLRLLAECNWWIKGEGRLDQYHWDMVSAGSDSAIPGHDDNEGDFFDYANYDQMVSTTLQLEWLPLHGKRLPREYALLALPLGSWISTLDVTTLSIAYRPIWRPTGVTHGLNAGVRIDLPGDFTLEAKK